MLCQYVGGSKPLAPMCNSCLPHTYSGGKLFNPLQHSGAGIAIVETEHLDSLPRSKVLVKEDQMDKQNFSSFYRVVVGTLTLIVAGASPVILQGQEEKLTREPVFRQPKLPFERFKEKLIEHEQSDAENQTSPPVAQVALQPSLPSSPPNFVRPGLVNTAPVATSDPSDERNVERQPIPGLRPPTPGPSNTLNSSAQPRHPLDDAISKAEEGLANIRANVTDYTALMVKRERVNGTLGDVEYMRIKVRNERQTENGLVPLSIYMNFVKPKAVKGREVIWVRGQNENKLSAHETGMIGFKTFHLDPDGMLAMRGNRYPIYEAGIENLVVRLIEKATRDRAAGDCEVQYFMGAKINKRSCSMIEVVHNERRSPYEFHKAQVFIDDELNIPIRYVSYDWPSSPGGKPILMEEYTYVDVDLNVGLTDRDFDITNPEYNYRESR